MKIAVLGGAGSGKSEVLRIMAEKYNADIIEADKLAHELYEKGNKGYSFITGLFGKAVLDPEGSIDRKKLGDILYNDPGLLDKVNKAIHPLVYGELYKRCTANESEGIMSVYEAAIIPKDPGFFDSVWYVYSPLNIRRRRLKSTRGYTDERIDSIISNQASEEEYRSVSDHVISNDGDLKKIEEEIEKALK